MTHRRELSCNVGYNRQSLKQERCFANISSCRSEPTTQLSEKIKCRRVQRARSFERDWLKKKTLWKTGIFSLLPWGIKFCGTTGSMAWRMEVRGSNCADHCILSHFTGWPPCQGIKFSTSGHLPSTRQPSWFLMLIAVIATGSGSQLIGLDLKMATSVQCFF